LDWCAHNLGPVMWRPTFAVFVRSYRCRFPKPLDCDFTRVRAPPNKLATNCCGTCSREPLIECCATNRFCMPADPDDCLGVLAEKSADVLHCMLRLWGQTGPSETKPRTL